ncbi:MAG: L-histidine N(alpha)-methyltransferase, partial [Pseudomonadota bacterium]|nr:L-histidine N(alpha)-methyltransferase [Pseudomonadota bacterium]
MLESKLVSFSDLSPAEDDFLGDVIAGLSASPKCLPCKYFYDAHGSKLFDQICELPEYYPTRTETALMREKAGEMAAVIGPGVQVLEYGCGSIEKVRVLLDALEEPASYIAV